MDTSKEDKTDYYDLGGKPIPYVTKNDKGEVVLSSIIDNPQEVTDDELISQLSKKREGLPITLPVIDNNDLRNPGVVELKKSVKTLITIDVDNTRLLKAREESLKVTNGLGGYTLDQARSIINACNIADGLYRISYLLNDRGVKQEFANLNPQIKGYVVDKITTGLNILQKIKPIYWNDEVNSAGKRYRGFYYRGNALEQHRVYTAEELKEGGQSYLSNGNYIAFPQSAEGLLDSEYAFRIQGVMSLLDKLTRVSTAKNESFIDAPLFEMYLTNPKDISNLFDSLVGLLKVGNTYSALNVNLKNNAMTIIARMISPDNIATQNLLQILTGQQSRFLSRLKDSGIVDNDKADEALEVIIEKMSKSLLGLNDTKPGENLIDTNPELISIIFQSNPEFIRRAYDSVPKEEGDKSVRYLHTKNLVNSVGNKIAAKLKEDKIIKAIISEKSEGGKKIVKLVDIESEIRNRYGIESEGIAEKAVDVAQKAVDVASKVIQVISQRGEIAEEKNEEKNSDPLITGLLTGKAREFFKDQILFSPPQTNLKLT